MTDTEIMKFLSVIPCKYAQDAEAADKVLEQDELQRLSALCHLMQDINSISADFDTAGKVIAEIYVKHDTYAIPALIRKIMYFLVYQAYGLQDTKKERKYGKLKNLSYQSMIMESVNKRFLELGKTKKWTNKLWSGDKWGMNPLRDYCDNIFDNLLSNSTNTTSYKAPEVLLSYAGKKINDYGYMLKSLVDQIPNYNIFVDAFGGSGAATMNIEPLQGCRYVLNDYDRVNVNYFRVLATRHTEFIEKMQKIQEHLKKYIDIKYIPTEEECDDFDSEVWVAYREGENRRIVEAIQKGQLKQTYQEGKNVGVSPKEGTKFTGFQKVNINDYNFLDVEDYEDIEIDSIPWGDIDVYDLLQYVNSKYTTSDGREITFEDSAKNFEFKRYLLEYLLDKDNQKQYSTKIKVSDFTKTLQAVYNHSAQEGSKNSSGEKIGNSVIVKYAKGLWYKYDVLIDEYRNSNKQVDVEVAVGFFFKHCFMKDGINDEISGVVSDNVDKFNDIDFMQLEDYHNRIRYCELLQKEGQYLVNDNGLNTENTIFYADPPYSATRGYEVSFGKKEMKTLISGFDKVKGNFIYSCVAGVASKNTRKCIKNNNFNYDALEEIAYEDNGNEKFVKQRKEIAEMLSWFLDICNDRQLYVIFNGFTGVSAKEMLKTCVTYNIKLEVMITDIDFDVDLINQNNPYNTIFRKMDFSEFYKIEKSILLG